MDKRMSCSSTVLTSVSRDPSYAKQQALQLRCFKKLYYHHDCFFFEVVTGVNFI